MTWHHIGLAVARAAVLVGVSGLVGCGGNDTQGEAQPTMPADRTTFSSSPEPRTPNSSPSDEATTTSPPEQTSPPEHTCAERTLDELGLTERVGQLFMGGVQVDQTPAFVPAALDEARVGSILLVGVATGGADAVSTAIDRGRTVTRSPAGAQPIVAVDQEGGRIQHLQGPGFEAIPSPAEQAQLTSDQLRRRAQSWGADLRSVGVNLDLAPVADVVPASIGVANEPIGALERGYGSDPASVGEHVAAFVTGMDQAGIATTVKHFPGLGRVRGNTDFSSGVVDDRTTRDDPGLAPFRAGIDAGAQFLMISLATYSAIDPDRRAVFSPTVIDGMVRDDLGFDGAVISDDLGVAEEVAGVPPGRRALDFLRAGGDIVVVAATPSTLLTMVEAVTTEARGDAEFRSAVGQHALRVLTVKQQMGLLSCD